MATSYKSIADFPIIRKELAVIYPDIKFRPVPRDLNQRYLRIQNIFQSSWEKDRTGWINKLKISVQGLRHDKVKYPVFLIDSSSMRYDIVNPLKVLLPEEFNRKLIVLEKFSFEKIKRLNKNQKIVIVNDLIVDKNLVGDIRWIRVDSSNDIAIELEKFDDVYLRYFDVDRCCKFDPYTIRHIPQWARMLQNHYKITYGVDRTFQDGCDYDFHAIWDPIIKRPVLCKKDYDEVIANASNGKRYIIPNYPNCYYSSDENLEQIRSKVHRGRNRSSYDKAQENIELGLPSFIVRFNIIRISLKDELSDRARDIIRHTLRVHGITNLNFVAPFTTKATIGTHVISEIFEVFITALNSIDTKSKNVLTVLPYLEGEIDIYSIEPFGGIALKLMPNTSLITNFTKGISYVIANKGSGKTLIRKYLTRLGVMSLDSDDYGRVITICKTRNLTLPEAVAHYFSMTEDDRDKVDSYFEIVMSRAVSLYKWSYLEWYVPEQMFQYFQSEYDLCHNTYKHGDYVQCVKTFLLGGNKIHYNIQSIVPFRPNALCVFVHALPEAIMAMGESMLIKVEPTINPMLGLQIRDQGERSDVQIALWKYYNQIDIHQTDIFPSGYVVEGIRLYCDA